MAACARALAFVQREAPAWGADPKKVVLMGHSAGAHLVALLNANPALAMETEQWQRVIDINLTGVWNSCKAEAELMLESGGGSIINIASMSGIIVNRGLEQAHYNSAKAGVHMFR